MRDSLKVPRAVAAFSQVQGCEHADGLQPQISLVEAFFFGC